MMSFLIWAIFFYLPNNAEFHIFNKLSDEYNDFYGYCNFSNFDNITEPYVTIALYYTYNSNIYDTTSATLQVSVTNDCNPTSISLIYSAINSNAGGLLPLGSAIAIGIVAGALSIIAIVVLMKQARCRPNHTKEVPDEPPNSTAM